jgi:hypothetical protein
MSNKSAQQAKHLVDTNYMGVRDRIEQLKKPRVKPNNKDVKQRKPRF